MRAAGVRHARRRACQDACSDAQQPRQAGDAVPCRARDYTRNARQRRYSYGRQRRTVRTIRQREAHAIIRGTAHAGFRSVSARFFDFHAHFSPFSALRDLFYFAIFLRFRPDTLPIFFADFHRRFSVFFFHELLLPPRIFAAAFLTLLFDAAAPAITPAFA